MKILIRRVMYQFMSYCIKITPKFLFKANMKKGDVLPHYGGKTSMWWTFCPTMEYNYCNNIITVHN